VKTFKIQAEAYDGRDDHFGYQGRLLYSLKGMKSRFLPMYRLLKLQLGFTLTNSAVCNNYSLSKSDDF